MEPDTYLALIRLCRDFCTRGWSWRCTRGWSWRSQPQSILKRYGTKTAVQDFPTRTMQISWSHSWPFVLQAAYLSKKRSIIVRQIFWKAGLSPCAMSFALIPTIACKHPRLNAKAFAVLKTCHHYSTHKSPRNTNNKETKRKLIQQPKINKTLKHSHLGQKLHSVGLKALFHCAPLCPSPFAPVFLSCNFLEILLDFSGADGVCSRDRKVFGC